MAETTITTTLVVNFSTTGDNQGHLSAEIDTRETGLNAGKNSPFLPGQEVGFLIYKSNNVVIDLVVASTGSIATLASGTETRTEFVTFPNETEGSVSKPITSFSYKWLGRSLGSLSYNKTQDQTVLTAANKGVAVAKVDYTTTFLQRKLRGIPTKLNNETTFDVLIFISGHVV